MSCSGQLKTPTLNSGCRRDQQIEKITKLFCINIAMQCLIGSLLSTNKLTLIWLDPPTFLLLHWQGHEKKEHSFQQHSFRNEYSDFCTEFACRDYFPGRPSINFHTSPRNVVGSHYSSLPQLHFIS